MLPGKANRHLIPAVDGKGWRCEIAYQVAASHSHGDRGVTSGYPLDLSQVTLGRGRTASKFTLYDTQFRRKKNGVREPLLFLIEN